MTLRIHFQNSLVYDGTARAAYRYVRSGIELSSLSYSVCGLRRAKCVGLRLEDLQLGEDHWIIADLSARPTMFGPYQFRSGSRRP